MGESETEYVLLADVTVNVNLWHYSSREQGYIKTWAVYCVNSFTQVTTYIKMENIHLSGASIICRSYSVAKCVVATKIFYLEVVCIYVQWGGTCQFTPLHIRRFHIVKNYNNFIVIT